MTLSQFRRDFILRPEAQLAEVVVQEVRVVEELLAALPHDRVELRAVPDGKVELPLRVYGRGKSGLVIHVEVPHGRVLETQIGPKRALEIIRLERRQVRVSGPCSAPRIVVRDVFTGQNRGLQEVDQLRHLGLGNFAHALVAL